MAYRPTNPGWGAAASAAKVSPYGTPFYTYKPQPNVPGAPLGGGKTPMTPGNTLSLKPGETVGHSQFGYYAVPGAAPGAVSPPPAVPSQSDFTKNYINSAWDVQQAQNQGDQSIAGAENSFRDNLRRAFIDFGGQDVSKLGDYGKYIDQATLDSAKANKFSALAQSLKDSTRAIRQSRAALAARGILSSGQATTDTLNTQNAREGQDYGSLRTFLGGAETGQQGLSQLRQQVADSLAAARQGAAARAADEYWSTIGQQSAAPSAPAASTPWGGISWGGRSGITTKAQLQNALGYGQSLAQWKKDHPTAWAKLG